MIEYENLALVNKPFFEEYVRSFRTTLERGWFILGEDVRKFEREFAAFCNVPHCIGVASGLDALTLSLRALSLEKGSEVIVPSNTFIATILSILHNGLQPVFVEPDIRTYNIDPKNIEDHITARTRAVIVVHLYGKACPMEPIMDIVRKHDLRLIEDCAQAHGAKFRGTIVGSFGDTGAFSFYPTKNLGALGDGGAVATHDQGIALAVERLRNYGTNAKYCSDVVGFNSRLDEVQAGFLLVKLRHLQHITEHKRKLAQVYFEGLKDEFVKPQVHPDYYDVFHIFNIRHPQRDKLRDFLLSNGVKTEIHYPVPPHRQNAMQGVLATQAFPIADEIHETTLSLPISYFHTVGDIERVVELMNKF